MDQGKILITEDEESLRFVLQKALETEGYWVQTAANGASARRLLTDSHFDISLMDIKLPDVDGLDLLKEIKENGTDTAMILMTAQNTMRNAIGAMKNGAFDYITKPFDLDEVLVLVKRAMDSRKLSRDFRELKEEVKKRFEPGVNIIGTSPSMQVVYKTIGQVVDTLATILILGESGTGKELVAKTIHYNSPRWNQPFVAINCAAIPRDLLESELFGHEKGAFTGALDRRLGKFELADGGTLFLDEVGDIPLELQTKLLRVLQDHEYSRVGGRDVLKADVRILAATNQDLDKTVKEKRFREDLYFRLKVIPIYLPPLRERRGDIALLIGYFIDKINREMAIQISGVSPRAGKYFDPRRRAVLGSDLVPEGFHAAKQTRDHDPGSRSAFAGRDHSPQARRLFSPDRRRRRGQSLLSRHRTGRTAADRSHAQENQRQSNSRRADSRHQSQHAAKKNHRSAHRAQKRTLLKFHVLARFAAALRHSRSGTDPRPSRGGRAAPTARRRRRHSSTARKNHDAKGFSGAGSLRAR